MLVGAMVLNKDIPLRKHPELWKGEDGPKVITAIRSEGGVFISKDELTYTDRNGNTTKYTHDSRGNLLKLEKPNGYTREIAYNGFSQPLTISDLTGTITFEYGEQGSLVRTTDQLGNTT